MSRGHTVYQLAPADLTIRERMDKDTEWICSTTEAIATFGAWSSPYNPIQECVEPIRVSQKIDDPARGTKTRSTSIVIFKAFGMRPNMTRPAKAASPKLACLIQTDLLPDL